MNRRRVFGLGLGCFVLGAIVQSGLAQSRKPVFRPDLVQGQDAKTAATALLDGALQLAESGSWERIAVGRAWYLGGDKAKGQQIFDGVTGGKKVEGSDRVSERLVRRMSRPGVPDEQFPERRRP